MSMNIIEDKPSTIHYHTRHIQFEGATPELYLGYTHKDKQWVPQVAYTQWSHGEPIGEISASGPILKKDGTPSRNRGSIRYITPTHHGWGKGFDQQAPQWLLDLFADSPHTTPEGA